MHASTCITRRHHHIGKLPPGAFKLLSGIKQRELARKAEQADAVVDQPAKPQAAALFTDTTNQEAS